MLLASGATVSPSSACSVDGEGESREVERCTAHFSAARPGEASRVGRVVEILAALLRASVGDCSWDMLLEGK